jgi:uroporphyrinogen III methyltransferase/synthase
VLGTGAGSVLERLAEGEVDVVTFTSSSTVRNFVELAKGIDLAAALKGALIASIGPITSDTARELGMTVGVEADEYTIPGLVQAVADRLCADIGDDDGRTTST